MSRNRYFSLCVLVLLGAFAGGYAANRAIPVAHAQVIPLPLQNIRGTGFTLVDPQGKVQAELRNGARGAELVLNDVNGKPRIGMSSSGVVIRDEAGRVVWQSPRATGIIPAGE